MNAILMALIAWLSVASAGPPVSMATEPTMPVVRSAPAPNPVPTKAVAAPVRIAPAVPACNQPPWETTAPTPYPGQGVTLTMAPNPVIVGVCPYLIVTFNGAQMADGTAIPGFDRSNLVFDGSKTDSRGVTLLFWTLTHY